jgi:hypothetical protein
MKTEDAILLVFMFPIIIAIVALTIAITSVFIKKLFGSKETKEKYKYFFTEIFFGN